MEQKLELTLNPLYPPNFKIQELNSFVKTYKDDLFLCNYSGMKLADKKKFIERISGYYKNEIIPKETISNSLRNFLEEIKEDYPFSYRAIKSAFSKELESC